MRTQSKTNKLPKARENASNQLVIGLSVAFFRFRGGCEFSGPITEQIEGKQTIPDYLRRSNEILLRLTCGDSFSSWSSLELHTHRQYNLYRHRVYHTLAEGGRPPSTLHKTAPRNTDNQARTHALHTSSPAIVSCANRYFLGGRHTCCLRPCLLGRHGNTRPQGFVEGLCL